MATSKKHTFEEILESGISIPNKQQPIKVDKIIIPKIQRAYAQGRKTEHEVRHAFLDDIFKCLCAPEEQCLELSFLFGSKQPAASGGYGFELLDGQQRITTLFLLYWYISNKEKGASVPDYLKRFTYETRDTATQFINNIVEKTIVIGDEKPSKILKSQKWFTEVFNCDASVCAMLTMMDAIDEKYMNGRCHDLYEKLRRLQFYVLYLDEFELNDELYIKMNSRGLDLTPFENFKAALIRFMKKENPKFSENVNFNGVNMPYYLRFSTKMDTVWSDIFFSLPIIPSGDVTCVVPINNKEKDKKFFRFIIRYFFTQIVLLNDENEAEHSSLVDFLYKNTQKDNDYSAESPHTLEIRLTGWEKFEIVLQKLGYKGVCKLEKVLDTFASYFDDIQNALNSYPYGSKTVCVFDEYKEYTLPNRVVFASIVEFIANIPNGTGYQDPIIQKNLKKMLRIMWNVIENTRIEDLKPAIGVIKSMSEIIHLPGAIDTDFYASIVNYQSRNYQIIEEIAKAKAISNNFSSDKDWESAFIMAERHPFFKGMIRFFYDDSISSSNEFVNRYEIIRNIFDQKGIATSYRQKEHILIRALISQMNFWDGVDGLKGKYITEDAEKEGYLKILLGTAGAKSLFCGLCKLKQTDIIAYLNQVISEAQWYNPNETGRVRMFNRLVRDTTASYLLNKMFEIEATKNKQFHIVDSCSVTLACIPYNDRIALDTERHLIIKELVANNGFNYSDADQEKSMNSPLGDAWGWDITIQKVVCDSRGNEVLLFMRFDAWKKVIFEIDAHNNTFTNFAVHQFEPISGDKWKYRESLTYDGLEDYTNILAKVENLESTIKQF